MFMRFVQLGIKPEAAEAFERFYANRVSPALLSEDGCLFASLIKSTESASEFISFTLWSSPEDATEYEESGRYANLVSENQPFQEESTEWKIQLTPENTLEYLPVQEDPEVKAMPVVAGSSEDDMTDKIQDHTYVRILNAQVNPDQFDELSDLYNDELVPELLTIPGCRAAYLIGMKERREGLSITVWDSQEAAHSYEESGKFAELLGRAAPYLSAMYQWKMTLDPSKQKHTHLSNDLSVKGYEVVTGKSVGKSNAT
jgi:heme-degrading monooxygenase HmoA